MIKQCKEILSGFFNKYGIYFLIFLIAFSIRAYEIHTKNYLFVDSPYSITCSSPNNKLEDTISFKRAWNNYDFSTGKTYKLSEIKKALFYNDDSIKSIIKDIYSIAINPLDKTHPSLYYSILRIWNSGINGLSTKQIINRGCTLNLLFFTLSFFFMYKLLSLIRNDKKFIALGLFFAFLSTGTISNTLAIREYALMETLLITTIYIFVCIYNKISNNEVLTTKDYIISVITLTLFSLSGYFSNILSVMLFIVLLVKVLKQNNKKYLKYLIILTISTILSVLIIDPGYVNIFATEHSGVVYNHLSQILSYSNIINFINVLCPYLFYNINIYIILVIFACFIPLIKSNQIQIQGNFKVFMIITFVWAYIVLSAQPWKGSNDFMHTVRFIAPAIPIMSIVLLSFTNRFNKYIQILIVFLFFISSILPVYPDDERSFLGTLTYHNNYSYLDLHNQILDLDKNTNENLVIVNPNWDYVNFLMYLPNDYNVRFENQNPTDKYVFDNYLLMNGEYGSIKISEEYFSIISSK